MKKLKKYRHLFALLAIPLLNLLYLTQNHTSSRVWSLVTEPDIAFPFVPAFAVPYLLWYPFLFLVLTLVLRRSVRQYYRTILALCIGVLVASLTYFLFQTTVPRPTVEPEGFFNGLVSFVYAHDEPFNCFPSTHVLSSTLMIYGAVVLGRKTRIAIFLFSLTIIASTLFIKQHVIADVLAGVLVAKFSYEFAGLLLNRFLYRERREKVESSMESGTSVGVK
ncbi:phosphatase PAP2 family protein [Cohnella soli]|uniref:Phosphatase PAP2 family protein n=1 Tax=Cohnella soli TaxID=425005 RepID=A0ABW0HWH1_9BACL